MPPHDHEQRLAALPQARHIESRWAEWLAAQQTSSGPSGLTLERQIARLSGFGGSEIGALVSERRGDYDPFTTAREICQQKLLLAPPSVTDPYELGSLQRGTDLEPVIRAYFHRMSGAEVISDALHTLQQHRHQTHPWMLYTPDDVVQLHGFTVLIDYKAPFEVPNVVPFRHGCQLHQGRLLAEDAGIVIDRMLLVAWDLQRWQPLLFMVDHNPALDEEIKAAGDHFWPFVLEGQLPPWPQTSALPPLELSDLDAANLTQLQRAALEYAQMDILAKAAKGDAERARAHLEALARTLNIGASQTGAVKLQPTESWHREAIHSRLPDSIQAQLSTPKWDVAQLVAQVRQLGGDPSAAMTSTELDLDAGARWLSEHQGIPAEHLQAHQIKASLSRRKADQAFTDTLREAAQHTLAEHLSKNLPCNLCHPNVSPETRSPSVPQP